MATKALITPEMYLATQFDREPELVHGEIVERPLPNFPHGNLQLRLGSRLMALQQSYPVFTGVEVRMRLAADVYRIPDISMWEGAAPEKLPASPPLLVAEVVSPDDRVNDLLQKLDEYHVWGVRHIWLIEPELKQIHVYDNGSLTRVSRLELPQFGFAVTAEDLFHSVS
jgi:Uma2 family endonuclease